MKAFLHHFNFEFKTGVRNKNLLLMNYLFPLGFFAMMGLVMPQINPLFLEAMIPAMVVFAILAAALLGIPDQLVTARENGIFRSYKINGVPVLSILIIPILTTLLHLIIVTAIICVTSPLLFKSPAPVNWPGFALCFIALALCCTAIAVLIGVVSPSSRMTVLWSQLLFVPAMLLGGMMIPFSFLPEGARKLALLLPATYGMNAFNSLAMGKTPDFSVSGSLIILGASCILALALALFLFSWDNRNTQRRAHPLFGFLVLLPFLAGVFLLK